MQVWGRQQVTSQVGNAVDHRRRLLQMLRKTSFKDRQTEYSPSLTLTLQESQDIVLPYGSLHVTDNVTGGVVQELYSDLDDTTTGASTSKDLQSELQYAITGEWVGKIDGPW